MQFARQLTFAIVLIVFVGTSASAQEFAIPTYAIAAGGGASADSNYTLFGTVGQPAIGSATAGTYTLSSGLGVAGSSSLPFADQPLLAGVTVVRAVHVSELRTRIDALRVRFGLGSFAYTAGAPAAFTPIEARHVTELRTALAEAYVAAGRTAPLFADPVLAIGTVIRARHLNELRAAVMGLED